MRIDEEDEGAGDQPTARDIEEIDEGEDRCNFRVVDGKLVPEPPPKHDGPRPLIRARRF